jgi:hypothetical protein
MEKPMKNLGGDDWVVYICSPQKCESSSKSFIGCRKKKSSEKYKKNFAEIKRPLTFAPRLKTGRQ